MALQSSNPHETPLQERFSMAILIPWLREREKILWERASCVRSPLFLYLSAAAAAEAICIKFQRKTHSSTFINSPALLIQVWWSDRFNMHIKVIRHASRMRVRQIKQQQPFPFHAHGERRRRRRQRLLNKKSFFAWQSALKAFYAQTIPRERKKSSGDVPAELPPAISSSAQVHFHQLIWALSLGQKSDCRARSAATLMHCHGIWKFEFLTNHYFLQIIIEAQSLNILIFGFLFVGLIFVDFEIGVKYNKLELVII